MAKNIVLLSDGTGNSAAETFKTNVWRFYQAVNINPPKSNGEPDQVVFYDDGVGTGNFKPIAAVGLALGLGLKGNIKDLYTFLCRNYEEGDNIFLLGFSRGAFTVRMLAGMVLRCGLVCADNEKDLRECVDVAYDAYRWDGISRAAKTGRAKLYHFFGRLFGSYRHTKDFQYVPLGDIKQRFPHIAFVGVWDTVDAYGMPVDEIKLGIDRFIMPMTLADRDLSPFVDRACHALSLDDDRPTFRPVPWNEVTRKDGTPQAVDEEKLTQIWFAGVHANVGGGYPDDGVAHVALQWMMDEAQRQGLWFYKMARDDADDRANPHGREYDSRSGLSGYYRYGPRNVDALCKDADHGVEVTLPKVHASVVERIVRRKVAYAPVSFPSHYVIMERDNSDPPKVVKKNLPPPDLVDERVADMESAWDAVSRRRYAYLATVWLTIVLFLPPFADRFLGVSFHWFSAAISWTGRMLDLTPGVAGFRYEIGTWIAWAMGYAASFSWFAPWVQWYQAHPLFFFVLAVLLAFLFFRKNAQLRDEILLRADFAWRRIRQRAPSGAAAAPAASSSSTPRQTLLNPVAHGLRTNAAVNQAYMVLTTRVIPLLLAVPALAFVLLSAIFNLPATWRLSALRKKYEVGTKNDKLGADAVERIAGVRCPIQPYQKSGPLLAAQNNGNK